MNIGISEQDIKDIISDEITTTDAMLAIYKWAVPHWEWVERIKIGAVQISIKTGEYIIDEIAAIDPKNKAKFLLLWMNQGPSIGEDMSDWRIQINMDKIDYKSIK